MQSLAPNVCALISPGARALQTAERRADFTLPGPNRAANEARSCLIATCETWSSTASLPALFAKNGLTVTSLSPGPLGLSRHVSKRIGCSKNPRLAAIRLREVLSDRRFDWVVVGDEALLRALAEGERESLADWFPVDPQREDLLAFITSKHAFAQLAPQFGIRVPEGCFVSNSRQCIERAHRLGYPVVVKGPHGFSGMEIFVARDPAELQTACETLLRRYRQVLVQRFIDGPVASVAVLYDRGEPLAYKSYVTECPFPRRHSAGTLHRTFRHPSVEPIVRAVGTATRFHGMAGIDFVQDAATGDLFALEINPRPTSAFAGLRDDRAFFGPAVSRFVQGKGGPLAVYDFEGRAQAYFPSYAFYYLGHESKRDRAARHRLLSCLSEAREAEIPLTAWEFARYAARFAYDRLGARSPRLRSWIDSRRAPKG